MVMLPDLHSDPLHRVSGGFNDRRVVSSTGPLVWYQKFEYAVSHWLQKTAEHVLGCVLCSPGCFSLYRAAALLDDNVMKTYTVKSTKARHYIQYDQGGRKFSDLTSPRGRFLKLTKHKHNKLFPVCRSTYRFKLVSSGKYLHCHGVLF